MNIYIYQGDADTITETIEGLSSLAGYTAKMYVVNFSGTAVITKTGTVSGLTVTYQFVNEDTKAIATGRYSYETKLFDLADHVYTPSKGKFIIKDSIEEDPA